MEQPEGVVGRSRFMKGEQIRYGLAGIIIMRKTCVAVLPIQIEA